MINGFSEIRKQGEFLTWYTFSGTTPRGETVMVSISKCCPDNSSPRSLPNLWHKAGYTADVLPDYWGVSTYATDPKGHCYGLYNPTEKPREIGSGMVLNFDWVLPATEANLHKLLAEIARRANAQEV